MVLLRFSKNRIPIILALTFIASYNLLALANENKPEGVYPLDHCIVSGEKLGDKPVIQDYNGRELRFCSQNCAKEFKKDPQQYLAKLDEEIIKQQLPVYPLETCVVTGEKLDTEGTPVNYIYKNRLVRFCCKNCIQTFEKDPTTYLKKLDDASVNKQLKAYPLDTCLVSGEKLGGMGEPVNYIYAGRLVRFCCSGCIDTFVKNPYLYLNKLDAAPKKATKTE